MKAISLWEPWGTAIAKGLKRIETRGWWTNHRGPLAIHCAGTRAHAEFIHDPAVWRLFQGVGVFLKTDLAFGCVVATCQLVEVVPTEALVQSGQVAAAELVLGNYEAGRWGWKLEDVRALAEPLPWKGRQGFFEVPDGQLITVSDQ